MSERKRDRAASTESILADVERRLGSVQYPVTGEELAAEYATDPMDLPNETESLGAALSRLETAYAGETFESASAARDAIAEAVDEVTGGSGLSEGAGTAGETEDSTGPGTAGERAQGSERDRPRDGEAGAELESGTGGVVGAGAGRPTDPAGESTADPTSEPVDERAMDPETDPSIEPTAEPIDDRDADSGE